MIDNKLIIFLIIVIIIVIIYYIDILKYGKRKIITYNPRYMITPKKYDCNNHTFYNNNKGISSTISFWMYLKDWNYKFMQYKQIFKKGRFEIYMPPKNNFLIVDVPITGNKTESLIYKVVPIQKWLNITIIIDNRHVDLWINGKMYVSKYLSNIPDLENNKTILAAENNGYDGYISRITSWKYPLSKSKIIRVFKAGPVDNTSLTKLKRAGSFLRDKIYALTKRKDIKCAD